MVDLSLSISAANGGSWHPSRARAQGIRSVCPQASPSPLDWIGKVWEHWITHPPPPLPTKSANLIGSLAWLWTGDSVNFVVEASLSFPMQIYCLTLGSHDAYKNFRLGWKWIRCCWSWGQLGPRHSGTTYQIASDRRTWCLLEGSIITGISFCATTALLLFIDSTNLVITVKMTQAAIPFFFLTREKERAFVVLV